LLHFIIFLLLQKIKENKKRRKKLVWNSRVKHQNESYMEKVWLWNKGSFIYSIAAEGTKRGRRKRKEKSSLNLINRYYIK